MRRIPFVIGILMILVGVYAFWVYFQILIYGEFLEQLYLWIAALVVAILLISFGPGVMVWAYATSIQSSYRQIAKQKQWQVIQVPVKCSSCDNEITIRSLEWIGDDEARCPFCSKDLEIRSSRTYSYS